MSGSQRQNHMTVDTSTPRAALIHAEVTMDSHCVGESDGLTFCLARPEDYDDVMAISQDIYGGNDYLPHRYHSWMTEPERVVIIARRDRKLVALESGLLVDGGETVIVEGLRVCPNERGCGLAGVIQRFVDGYIKKVYPNVKTKRLTRGDDPGPEKLSKFRLLARRAVLSLWGDSEGFDSFVSGLKDKLVVSNESNSSSPLVPVKDLEALKTLLLDSDLSSRLQLPGGAIIQDWQPLKLMESNLQILARRNLTWFVDGSGGKPLFMSFHTPPYPIPFNGGSLRFNIDLYGTDTSLAKKALTAHLNSVKSEIQGLVLVHIYMHQTLWADLKQFCEGHETAVRQLRDYWEQLFLEREP
ncbi:N-acetyltransferase 16, like isoform X2 [Carassius auratus]|uniref:N-acetyltransferase 16, like isoform X2 n=1 Tax=Carassius auratus TaxID=7957 RepID=A0A6P6PRA5_CARAU|nr:histidine N-acetyltransferase-like isoform X2 [Carassius auratus]